MKYSALYLTDKWCKQDFGLNFYMEGDIFTGKVD